MWLSAHLTEDLKNQLQAVEQLMQRQLQSNSPTINQGIGELLAAGGKRLRPLLTLLAASYGKTDQHIIEIATIPEVIHLASLIHDDVIDMASTRRGLPAMHKKYGTAVAVYAGDYLLLSTTHRLMSYFSLDEYCEFSADLMKILAAEIVQMEQKNQWQTNLKSYLKIVEGKTARLLKLSIKLGAYHATVAPCTQRKLVAIAHNIGMAFQIVDDCLDFCKQGVRIGKPVSQDLKNGYMTLPVILKCQRDASFIQYIKQNNGRLSAAQIATQLDPDIEQAMRIAHRYSQKAKMQVAHLPAHHNNAIWEILIDQLLIRKG